MHAPRERIVPGTQTAVVFIHGIVSTPRFWDDFTAALPQDVSFINLLLPGHGGTVRDFGRVRRGAWRQHVHEALLRMKKTHAQVYLVGHSMGALLSILEAADEPEGIAGLMLMATPLRIRVKPSAMLSNMLKGIGLTQSREELAKYYGTEQDWRIWRYAGWIPRYLELFSLSRQAREALPRLRTPARAFQHGRDELVSPRSGKLLLAHPAVSLQTLHASGHHDVASDDRQQLLAALREMLPENP